MVKKTYFYYKSGIKYYPKKGYEVKYQILVEKYFTVWLILLTKTYSDGVK